MGIDLIRGGRIPNRGTRNTKTPNTYLKTLIKVHIKKFSFILSFPEELIRNSTKQFIKGWINQDSTVTQFLYQELQEYLAKIGY